MSQKKGRQPADNRIETVVWECANGHWNRVEFTFADGIAEKAICCLCKQEMKLGTKMLEPLRSVVYNGYRGSFNNAATSKKTEKEGGNNAKNKRKRGKASTDTCSNEDV